MNKLKGVTKLLMIFFRKQFTKHLEKKEETTEAEKELYELFYNGKSLVDEENLKEVYEYLGL